MSGSYTYSVSTANAMVFEMRPPVVVENVTPAKPAAATVVTDQKTTSTLAMGAFIIFVLFFLGALASCFGGSCGMMMCCHDEEGCEHGKKVC